MIEIWTMQLAKWRIAKKQNIHILNITLGSGLTHFAPGAEELAEYKRGEMNQDIYGLMYLERMRSSYRRHREHWEALEGYPRMALTCYCPAGEFCHRHLFKELLKKHFRHTGVEFVDRGELTVELEN